MATVTIYLCPGRILRVLFKDKKCLSMVRDEFPNYTWAGTFEWEQVGEEAAHEAFDLTNNPGRQDEREDEYGHERSVSSGDIIEVDGVKYVCLSIGWAVL